MAQLDQSRLLTEPKDLGEEAGKSGEVALTEGGDGVMVGVLIAGYDAVGDFFTGGTLQLTRGGHASGVAVEQEPCEHGRVIPGAAAEFVLLVFARYGRENEGVDRVGDKQGQMIGWQPVFQAGRQKILVIEIVGQKLPGHEPPPCGLEPDYKEVVTSAQT